MKRRKFKRSYWLPWVLAIYAGAMSVYFGPRLIAEGEAVRFWISVGAEVLIIVALFFALRHKEKMRARREEEARQIEDKKASE